MTSAEKYVYWRILSDYDIDTAKCLIEGKRWVYVTFVCHQSVERLLKGMHVYHTKKETPKTHNLNYIFNRIIKAKVFLDSIEDKEIFDQEKVGYIDFMVELMFFYMNDYPFSYKKVMDRFIGNEKALEIYDKTLDLLAWLKSFQIEPSLTDVEKGVDTK